MTEPEAEDTFDSAEIDLEAPENDVLEQHRPAGDDAQRAGRREPPLEADAADAAEQDLDADADEDEYR
ncbi:MAG: hypothetical protein ACRDOY_00760 [Nocardioidaceae bacterium]